MMTHRNQAMRWVAIVAAAAAVTAACGGDDDGDQSASTVTAASEETVESGAGAASSSEAAQDLAEGMVDDLEEMQESQGGGGALLTVGDESWSFDSVLCAFGEEEIGQEGAEFVLSAIQDGLQLYVTIDGFGQSVTLDDVEDFQNPSVGLSDAYSYGAATGDTDFIQVDGNSVTVSAPFVDTLGDSLGEPVDGTLEATCP
jgi:hypothetical protein